MTIYFHGATDDYAAFSNFAPYGVEMDGLWWRTVEHYFQAMKFPDEAHRERIRAAGPPGRAKRLGLSRAHPIRPDWDELRDAVMLDAVRVKFRTHEAPRTLLLSTGEEKIAENSGDLHWGTGPDGSRLNRLGEILMRVRAELRAA